MQLNDGYKDWLYELKARIQSSQIKAALAVNGQLIILYWDLGRQIAEKQQMSKWGSGLIERLASDLKIAFPDLGGFSKTNLIYCRKFFEFYKELLIGEQLVHQLNMPSVVQEYCLKIPWGHNILLFKKIPDSETAIFYLKETIANNWSRSVLEMQIESNLHKRQGKAISNFQYTLPKPQSDLATQLLKDPYNFAFLTLEKEVQELELERKLVQNITQFLLELGKGFAYMGRQYELKVSSKDYRLDLLFYHVKLKCYVVIELKTTAFEPEFVGKLNFYLSAIDSLVKEANDNTTIGILVCKTKDNLNVEFALKDINKPIGLSEYTFSELPLEIQREIPTVEEFEKGLMDIN